MSSPASTAPSRNTRSRMVVPKRKTRFSSEASAPPRKRSRVHENGAVKAIDANGDAAATESEQTQRKTSIARSLAVKERRASRATKSFGTESGGILLSKTPEYTIRSLPALPDPLKKDSGPYRAFFQSFISSSNKQVHQLIATTPASVLLWDYASSTPTPVPTIISLPPPRLKPTDNLPLAMLTSNPGSEDIGLLVVYATSGKILYWQNLEQANPLGFQRTRPAREGSLKLMSGECVEELVRVKQGGFIVVLSSGRLGYIVLTVPESAGVFAPIFSSDASGAGSWLSSFRATLSGGWRNTIVAVKTRDLVSHFETIALTSEGVLKAWDVQYHGASMAKTPHDLGDLVLRALQSEELVEQGAKPLLKFIGFELAKAASKAPTTTSDTELVVHMVALVLFETDEGMQFAIVHVAVGGGEAEIQRLQPIHVYRGVAKINPGAVSFIVPDPGFIAYITMPNVIIIASLEKVFANPRDEIRNTVYQDAVYMRFNDGNEIITCSPEAHHVLETKDKTDLSNLLVFCRHAGSVKVTANRPSRDPDRQRLSARTKVEQAVFFGDVPRTALDLYASGNFGFSQQEIEEASLQLSHEILTNANENCPEYGSAMEDHIAWRIKHLKRLATFVLTKYPPLSRATRWRLMWDAEKMECASALWKTYDRWLTQEKSESRILLPQFVKAINETRRAQGDPSRGEDDPVRLWFAKDVNRVDRIMDHLEQVVIIQTNPLNEDEPELVRYLQEAQDVALALVSTAYEFRNTHLATYHLEKEGLADGLLPADRYEDLPEPWTATKRLVDKISGFEAQLQLMLIKISDTAIQHQDIAASIEVSQNEPPAKVDMDVVKSMRQRQGDLVHVSAIQFEERYRWLTSRRDEQERQAGGRLKSEYETKIKRDQYDGLGDLGQAMKGMQIAEKMEDVTGLVQLCIAELEYCTDPQNRERFNAEGIEVLDQQKEQLFHQLRSYFDKYGKEFGDAFFSAQIKRGRLADLLQLDFGKNKELTAFLRADEDRGKISWMNDILMEWDLLTASRTLLKVAQYREPSVWAKQAQLSMAKLQAMAASKIAGAGGVRKAATIHQTGEADQLVRRAEKELRIIELHAKLFAHVRTHFESRLSDVEGAVDQAMKHLAKHRVKDRPANAHLLRHGLSALAQRHTIDPAVLIDILTLMDSVSSVDDESNIAGSEFIIALKVLDASDMCDGHDTENGDMLRGLIWKRLMLADDWAKVHSTQGKRDKDIRKRLQTTLLYRTIELGYLLTPDKPTGIWSTTPAFTLPSSPQEVRAAGSTPASLAFRFPSRDIAAPIAADNARDTELLDGNVQRHRMAVHYESIKELALQSAEERREGSALTEEARLEVRMKMRECELLMERGVVGEFDDEGEGDEADYDDDDDDPNEADEEVLTEEQIRAMGLAGDGTESDEADVDMAG